MLKNWKIGKGEGKMKAGKRERGPRVKGRNA